MLHNPPFRSWCLKLTGCQRLDGWWIDDGSVGFYQFFFSNSNNAVSWIFKEKWILMCINRSRRFTQGAKSLLIPICILTVVNDIWIAWWTHWIISHIPNCEFCLSCLLLKPRGYWWKHGKGSHYFYCQKGSIADWGVLLYLVIQAVVNSVSISLDSLSLCSLDSFDVTAWIWWCTQNLSCNCESVVSLLWSLWYCCALWMLQRFKATHTELLCSPPCLFASALQTVSCIPCEVSLVTVTQLG